MELAILVPVLVALVAPLGAYLLAARKMSGRIGTSDVADLWAESKSMRNDYRERLHRSDERVDELEERISKLEGLNQSLAADNANLRQEVEALRGQVATFKLTITELETTIHELRDQKKVLEKEVDNG